MEVVRIQSIGTREKLVWKRDGSKARKLLDWLFLNLPHLEKPSELFCDWLSLDFDFLILRC